eukprot:TRINITY_DN42952_c0_g1_i1.p1 TRINITY_DN42952_c0_g1~~TRINITY_DN42952_c0_g1_i1.p1  ORF type:complete len:1013 (+),score=129.43 TRINITY_DN42952_c0_g1_i1:60-3098(+)
MLDTWITPSLLAWLSLVVFGDSVTLAVRDGQEGGGLGENGHTWEAQSERLVAYALHELTRSASLDCFISEAEFRMCCCDSDAGDLTCWAAHEFLTWRYCCAHLAHTCPIAESTASNYGTRQHTSSIVVKADTDLERSCWSSSWNLRVDGGRTNIFPRERCCDKATNDCWSTAAGLGGKPFLSSEECCGALWFAHRLTGCTQGILAEAWEFASPASERTYRDFWQSSTFHALSRVTRNALNARDEVFNTRDTSCVLAFITSRVLVFSKLEWDEQWELLGDERGPREIHAMLDVRLAVMLLLKLPWGAFLTDSSEWFHRGVEINLRHSRKLRNFLTPDALPFPSDGHFPVFDAGMAPDARAFCRMLWRRLHRGRAVRLVDADAFLATHSPGRRDSATDFAVAMVSLAKVHALLLLSDTSSAGSADLEGALSFAKRSFTSFGTSTAGVAFAGLLFTAWPFWYLTLKICELFAWRLPGIPKSQLRARVGRAAVESAVGSAKADMAEQLLVVYCGPLDIHLGDDDHGNSKLLRNTSAFEPGRAPSCREALLLALRSTSEAPWVAILSPFLESWGEGQDHILALRDATRFMRQRPDTFASIVGFPVVDPAGLWRWPVRRLRHEFWKLRYEPYPTGHSLAIGYCVGGDTTSGTRVYRGSFLRELLTEIGSDAGDETGANLLVELDLLAVRRGIPAYTCMHPPVVETSYLGRAVLTPRLGAKYNIDVAEFLPLESWRPASFSARGERDDGGGRNGGSGAAHWQELCVNVSAIDALRSPEEFAWRGMATPWCWRRELQRAVQSIVSWWTRLDPARNVALPKQGTLLTALVRGGEIGAMPWDLDFELVLASRGSNPIFDRCRAVGDLTAACVASSLRRHLRNVPVKLSSGTDSIDIVHRMLLQKFGILGKVRLFVGPRGAIDVTLDELHDDDAEGLYRVRLFGEELHFLWHQWEYQLFEIYGGDLRKKIGTSGTIDKTASCDHGSVRSNLCLRSSCDGEEDLERGCVLEMPDWFAHTMPDIA